MLESTVCEQTQNLKRQKIDDQPASQMPQQVILQNQAGRPAYMCGLIPQDHTRTKHLNGLAADNCPIGGQNQRACGKDVLLAGEAPRRCSGDEITIINEGGSSTDSDHEVKAAGALSNQSSRGAGIAYVHQSVCRRIWRSLTSQPDPLEQRITGALHSESAQIQQADYKVVLGNLTLDAMFPPDVVKCVASTDLHRLHHLLEDSVQSPAVQLETFRETVSAILSGVARQCTGIRDKQSSEAKASTLQCKFMEELMRRVNCFCSACGGPGTVFLCSCGEGYCATCYGDPGGEYMIINCLMCRLDQGVPNLNFAKNEDIIRHKSVHQCLNCQRRAKAQCPTCGTSFCQQCALELPKRVDESKGWRCILCTGSSHITAKIAQFNTCRERKGNNPSMTDQLSALHMSLLSCGMSTIAVELLPALCTSAVAQLADGFVSSITPQQIIASLGRSHCVSTRLLSRILEGRAKHSKMDAERVEARAIAVTMRRLRKSAREAGPLRLGYFISPSFWSLSMLECIAPWLRRFDRLQFSLTLICLCSSKDSCSVQALEKILEGIEDVRRLIIGEDLLDEDAYQMVCSASFDIAVDLDCGGGERRTLKAMRGIAGKLVYAVGLPCPQPKQQETNKFCDFVLGDDRSLPAELRSAWQGLTPVLKVSQARPFWVSKAIAARRINLTTREDFQFPRVGFIFMHVEEVSPASPEAMRLVLSIVHSTPGSCLVMCGQTQFSRAYLRRETLEFTRDHSSFDPQLRVLYRRWPERTEERVQLLSHGDLLLATCEGGSVTAAGLLALAACLPVLVRVPNSASENNQTGFGVQRDICSALWNLGLTDELVAHSTDLFIEKARELGNHKGRILQLKQHLVEQTAAKTVPFSEDRQVREWENGLRKVNQANGRIDNDIDATLAEYPTCVTFKMKMSTDCSALKGLGDELGAALEREGILNQMANTHKEFNNPTTLAQLDSLLEDAQERGVRLSMQSGRGGFSSVVLGSMGDSPKVRGVLPGQKLALVFEKRKRSATRLYNGLLFRYANIITVNRTRKQFDRFMVQPVRLFENGTSCFSISYPDESGESICCLVLEGLDHDCLDGLKDDIKGWTDTCRLSDRLRCDMQHTLYALNTIHDSSIVHRDIRPDNIMRNSEGRIIFIDWGSGWFFGGPGTIVQRRATSSVFCGHGAAEGRNKMKGGNTMNLAALISGRRAKEMVVKRHLPLVRGKCKKHKTPLAKGPQPPSSRLSDERKPIYLSDSAIHSIMRKLAERGDSLAILGNGSELFKRADLWCESGGELTLERAKKQDVYALFRTFMMLFRPLGTISHTQWERAATKAAESQQSMLRFLLDGGSVMLQPRALEKLADFLFRGITDLKPKEAQTHEFVTSPVYCEAIEHSIFQGHGYLVRGGEMSTVMGCPFPKDKIKDVLVVREGKMGAGLRAVESYEENEVVAYYYAVKRVGLEINEDPPGRYVVAVKPQFLYANGEFTPELTLELFGEKKAMGVCINAATNAKSRNCYLMRIHTKSDVANSKYLWTPLLAARRIVAGEYFAYTYNHEAAGGSLRGYDFRVKDHCCAAGPVVLPRQ